MQIQCTVHCPSESLHPGGQLFFVEEDGHRQSISITGQIECDEKASHNQQAACQLKIRVSKTVTVMCSRRWGLVIVIIAVIVCIGGGERKSTGQSGQHDGLGALRRCSRGDEIGCVEGDSRTGWNTFQMAVQFYDDKNVGENDKN